MQRIWVTGYRSYELNIFGSKDPKITIIKYALKKHLKALAEENKLDWIITGANLGVEQWAAEVGLELQKEYPLHVSVMIPYENFSSRWNESNQEKFIKIKDKVDFFASTSNSNYASPVQLRNYENFMIQHTDSSLMVYDPEHPGKPKFDYEIMQNYQESHDYPIDLLDFYDLQDYAEKYQEEHGHNNA